MAWYDAMRWHDFIHTHATTNTPKALPRGMVGFCSRCPDSHITSLYHSYQCDDPPGMDNTTSYVEMIRRMRVAIFIRILTNYATGRGIGSYDTLMTTRKIYDSLRENPMYDVFVTECSERVDAFLGNQIPEWYAWCIANRILEPLVSPEAYHYSSHYATTVKLNILRGTDIYKEHEVLANGTFDDSEDYCSRVRVAVVSGRLTGDLLIEFIRYADLENLAHLTHSVWVLCMETLGCENVYDLAEHTGLRLEYLASSQISLPLFLDAMERARNLHQSDEDITPGIVSGTVSFVVEYNDAVIRNMGLRSDMTYECYLKILRNTPAWNSVSVGESGTQRTRHECDMPLSPIVGSPYGYVDAVFWGGLVSTPHEHVLRDFMDNKEDWRHILKYCREKTGETPGWRGYCMGISRREYLTLEDVLELPEIEWDWENLSRNASIATPENIRRHPELPWVWGDWGISASKGITPEFILENHNKGLVFIEQAQAPSGGTLSNNPVVTTDIIDKLTDHPWDYSYSGLSNNPNVMIPWLLANLNQDWDPVDLVSHIQPDTEVAAKAIQAWWRLIIVKRRCAWLASEVEEWWYNPDCKPAAKIRDDLIWSKYRDLRLNPEAPI